MAQLFTGLMQLLVGTLDADADAITSLKSILSTLVVSSLRLTAIGIVLCSNEGREKVSWRRILLGPLLILLVWGSVSMPSIFEECDVIIGAVLIARLVFEAYKCKGRNPRSMVSPVYP